MRAIGHEEGASQAVLAEDAGDRLQRLERRAAVILPENGGIRDAVRDRIGARARSLRGPVALATAARDDQDRGDAGREEVHRVIEPGREDRRRRPVVLRRSQHDDRVDRPRLVGGSPLPDPEGRVTGGEHAADDHGKAHEADFAER